MAGVVARRIPLASVNRTSTIIASRAVQITYKIKLSSFWLMLVQQQKLAQSHPTSSSNADPSLHVKARELSTRHVPCPMAPPASTSLAGLSS